MKAQINFIKLRLPAIIFSTILILIGIWFICGPKDLDLGVFTPKGFNLGVDFQGGLIQQITIYSGVHQDEVRDAASKAGLGNDIQQVIIPDNKKIGKDDSYLLKTMITEKEQKEMKDKDITASKYLEGKMKNFYQILEQKVPVDYILQGNELKKANELFKDTPINGEKIEQKTDKQRVVTNIVRESQSVTSPSYSKGLQFQAILLVCFALMVIFIYVLFRFNFKFSIGAIFSTIHDTLVMVGFVAIFQIELDMTIIAALLTLIGYSINDTIVIFDRVRENYQIMKDFPPKQIFNDSINKTLNRTIVTVTVTVTAVIALLIWGGAKIYGFSLVLLVGMIFGTYSSIFIAAPVVNLWDTLFSKREKQRVLKEKKKEEKIKAENLSESTDDKSNTIETNSNETMTISNLSKSKLKKLSGQKKK